MSDRDAEFLSEAEAVRLWQRAAELQAEAARRAEVRAEEDGAAEAGRAVSSVAPEGYALTHVRAAAHEAGITAEFVDAALADLRAEREVPTGGLSSALAHRVIPSALDAIVVRRVVEASPDEVLTAMETVLPAEPYRLALVDRRGDPLDGGVLIFDIQGAGIGATEGLAAEAAWADLRQVHVSLRPVPGPAPACEITIRGPVAWAHAVNAGFSTIFVGVSGGLGLVAGSFGGAAVGSALAALGLGVGAVAAASTAVAIGGVVAGGVLGLKGFSWLYDHGMRKGERALGGIAASVAVRAQGGFGLKASRADAARSFGPVSHAGDRDEAGPAPRTPTEADDATLP
jgi:hypothetical protein